MSRARCSDSVFASCAFVGLLTRFEPCKADMDTKHMDLQAGRLDPQCFSLGLCVDDASLTLAARKPLQSVPSRVRSRLQAADAGYPQDLDKAHERPKPSKAGLCCLQACANGLYSHCMPKAFGGNPGAHV